MLHWAAIWVYKIVDSLNWIANQRKELFHCNVNDMRYAQYMKLV